MSTDRESPTTPAPPPDEWEPPAETPLRGVKPSAERGIFVREDLSRFDDARRELEPAGEYSCAACDGHIIMMAGNPLVACTDCVLRLRMFDAARVVERIVAGLNGDPLQGAEAGMVENRSIPDQKNAPPATAENKRAASLEKTPLLDRCGAHAWIDLEHATQCCLAKGHSGSHQIIVPAADWF